MNLAPRLLNLATATGQLSARQVKLIGGALDTIDVQNARRTALERATAILDPKRELSRWALALRLEAHLARFDAVGAKRVRNGYRQPTELEKCLIVLLESGPRSAHRLWEELRDLPARW